MTEESLEKILNELPKTVDDKVINELEIAKKDAIKKKNYEYAKAVEERIGEIKKYGLYGLHIRRR